MLLHQEYGFRRRYNGFGTLQCPTMICNDHLVSRRNFDGVLDTRSSRAKPLVHRRLASSTLACFEFRPLPQLHYRRRRLPNAAPPHNTRLFTYTSIKMENERGELVDRKCDPGSADANMSIFRNPTKISLRQRFCRHGS
jgi:hypothetical protein